MDTSKLWTKLLLLLAVLALLAAACGSDDDSGSESESPAEEEAPDEDATEEAAAEEATEEAAEEEATEVAAEEEATAEAAEEESADDVLGEPNPAEGDPVKIGLLTNKGSESLEAQGQLTLDGATVALEYVNEYLGGVGGRPIELIDCGIGATPELATDCSNQMVDEGVAAVILPFAGSGDSMVPIITGAGIPYITGSGSTSQELTAPGAFSLSGGYLGTLGAVAQHAADAGIEKLTHIVIDVPAASGAATAIGGPLFETAGVEYEVVTAPPGTPDLTPQLQAAAGDGAVMVTGDVTFCTSFLQAYQTLALDNPKYLIATCIDEAISEAIPGAYEGAFVATGTLPDGEDAAVYTAMIERYAPDSDYPRDPATAGGFASGVAIVVNFAEGMIGLTDHSAEGIMAQIAASAGVPIFLSDVFTYGCAEPIIPVTPNVCAVATYIGPTDADGRLTEFNAIDPTPLFTEAFGG
jgi:branched-chain amino acid transport system substrate-binding protein